MNGEQLRAARRELGWTQKQLADAAKLNLSQIAVLERGTRPSKPEVVEAVQRVLLEQLGRVLEETGEHPVVDVEVPPDVTRTASWHGLRRGDEVSIAGEKGRFSFLFHYQDDKQEYVQVFGPIPGTVPRSRSPKAPHERSIRPERIVPPKPMRKKRGQTVELPQ